MKPQADHEDAPYDESCEHPAEDDHDPDHLWDTDTDAEDTYSMVGGTFHNGVFAVPTSPPIVWKLVKVGQTILHVSSTGRVKPYQSLFLACEGYQVPGTPYRSFPVTHENGDPAHIYMHDLVWRAFHGPPPDGWQVRHSRCVGKRTYSNALSNLAIYPSLDTI